MQTNGKPVSLEKIREQRKLVRGQIQLAKLKAEQKILENIGPPDYDDFGGSDLWDALRSRYQDGGEWFLPPTTSSDRRHGTEWPFWRNDIELDRLRQFSRVIVRTNSYARGLLQNLTNYVVGKGFSYEIRAKKGGPLDQQAQEQKKAAVPPGTPPAPEEPARVDPVKIILRQFQAVVDDFLKRNRWNAVTDIRTGNLITGTREREGYRRVKRDGEAFVRLFFEDEGTLSIRFVEPEQIRNPPGKTQPAGWTYGILHQMTPYEDIETRLAYGVRYMDPASAQQHGNDGVGEEVPAEEMLHLMGPDIDANVIRGTPEFAYEVGGALQRAAKLQRNISMGAAVRAATAEIWKHTVGTQGQIASLAGGFSTPNTDGATGANYPRERIHPGTIRRIPAGQEPVWPQGDVGVSANLEAVQGDLRQAGAAFCAPEYFTGDASNANYASTKEATAPAVKNGESEQEYYKAAYGRVVWLALEWSAKCGRLPAHLLDALELQVEAPAVVHNELLEKAQADQIKVQGGWKSPQTCAMEDGLDPDIEMANLEEHQGRFGAPGMGLDLPPEEGGEGKPPERKPQPVREGFDPGEKRDNSGKWTSGGGGSGGDTPKAPEGVKSVADLHTHAEGAAKAFLAKTRDAIKAIPGKVVRGVKNSLARQYKFLENRYGRKQAIGIMAGGVAIGLASPLAVVPGSTTIGMAPLMALAEGYLQAKKLFAGKSPVKESAEPPELSLEETLRLGKQFLDQLAAEVADHHGDGE